jgi:GMP synthase (glutamine-hydrolysing)
MTNAIPKKIRIHCLQHVSFEGPAIIKEWADKKGHLFSFTRFYENDPIPGMQDFDWLVIMGGPMGVYEQKLNPWLITEISLIRGAIDASKTVIGICLGAQLIACALGAEIKPGKMKEIGWFPVYINKSIADPLGLEFLPEEITVFHWHGDTFGLPASTMPLASSGATPNQAFLYKNHVLALQFHFEMNPEALAEITSHGASELISGRYIQHAGTIMKGRHYLEENNAVMKKILDKFEEDTLNRQR